MGNTNVRRIQKAATGQTRVLKLKRKRLSYGEVVALGYALMSEKNCVQAMELHSNQIGSSGLSVILDSFAHTNCHVLRLCLCYDLIGRNGISALSDALCDPSIRLVSLILQANDLRDDGAAILANALKHENNHIHVLYLMNNNIGLEGVRAIADALSHENNKVVELSLAGNSIGNEGTKAITKMLRQKNNRIRYLRLGFNDIDNAGAAMIADAAMDKQCKLRQLDLECNVITDPRDLVRAMKLSLLHWIDLEMNPGLFFQAQSSFREVHSVFLQKRQFWQTILIICSVHTISRLSRKRSGKDAKCHLRSMPRELVCDLAHALYPWSITNL